MKLIQVLLSGIRADQPSPEDVAEGSLYFVTDEELTEQSQGAVGARTWEPYSGTGSGAGITALTGDVTATGPGSVAATIANNAVTSAKILNDAVTTSKILNANVTLAKIVDVSAASKLIGRGAGSGSGVQQEITLGTNLSMSGTTLNAADTDTGINQLTGDVTAGPGNGSQAATIANNAVVTAKILDANVTLAKLVDASAASVLLGRGSAGGSGDFQEITLGTGLSMASQVLSASGSASGLVLLATRTAAVSATLDFTSVFSSTYDDYVFEIEQLVIATTANEVVMQVSTDNGSTWAASTDYAWSGGFFRNSTTTGNGSNGQSEIHLSNGVTMNATAAEGGLSGTVKIYGVNSSSRWKHVTVDTFAIGSDGNYYRAVVGAAYKQTTAVNAIRFKSTTGNLTSGVIKCYGLLK